MTGKEHTIWQSYGMMSLKEIEEQEKATREYLAENYPDEEFTDEDITDRIYDDLNLSFEDEECNLGFKETDGRILMIANLGLWNGRKTGYKILGHNLSEILTSSIGCDEKRVYVDRYNAYAEGYHHDGSNSVMFREIREYRNIDNLLNKLYSNEEISKQEINYYTRSLRKPIAEIYGF